MKKGIVEQMCLACLELNPHTIEEFEGVKKNYQIVKCSKCGHLQVFEEAKK